MKLKTSIILSALAISATSSAIANPVWDLYVGATVGVGAETVFADGHKTTNTAQSFGALAGVDVPLFRFEAEYNYLNETDYHAHLAMMNAYFKIPSAVIKPYLGAGVGLVLDGENDAIHAKYDNTATYQGMIGVTLDVPALPFKFDVEGRAIYIPNMYKFEDIRPDLLHYEGRIKIRYIF